ncbi:bifunctional phosphoserine phosphatase/homoserine phosphotransferase ThrH [Candidatus Nitronereus thalassa]|uniref:phosphoserine phosphatase n=1 Tax=Candidatus Nitronereus thalassa TaxID=3020898 RepID=A0ABU3K6R1_9BACT|nr:bifunctional phosphoserine phosphatase/homoserine phosphotransferase ThrH [Candidatus Nitronereus thalassa]MDT7042035.1 bifunctional phosphoserine phosphatase/homoserine phosphotransferase ThrH [Candidatus Nitronereus thalassa]
MTQPVLTCLDMEGVLTPEIWLAVADKTGIADLKVTTRDIPDYDELMRLRLKILADHRVRIADIRNVVATLKPLEGAAEFLDWLRARCQVIILSDTFYDLVAPLMQQLQYPSIFCHTLEIDEEGFIRNYHLRQADQKRHAVAALKNLNFRVLAAGDSYNDISMLKEANVGVFFCPPDSIKAEFPQIPVARSYQELQGSLSRLGGLVNS